MGIGYMVLQKNIGFKWYILSTLFNARYMQTISTKEAF